MKRRTIKVSTYTAERENVKWSGSAKYIAEKIGKPLAYVYNVLGKKTTREGWKITRRITRRVLYIATHPEEDPIIGDAEEISTLLGIHRTTVYVDVKNQSITRDGWRIRYYRGNYHYKN